MQYDPIKRKLGRVFNSAPFTRKLFYRLLDLLLLRSWHVHKAIREWEKTAKGEQNILDAGSGKQEQIDDCNSFFKEIGLTNATFGFADLTKLSEKEKYNLVISVDVMEHIEEDEKVFSNFYKALKPGGMLLVSTPSDQGGSDVHDHDHEHENYENDGTYSFVDEHVRDGYGIEEITDKLKRAGFKKTEVYYQYGTPGKISWKLSMKYPILMLNTSYLFFILLPFYYILTFPVSFVLNYFDVYGNHKTGTGVVAKAWK